RRSGWTAGTLQTDVRSIRYHRRMLDFSPEAPAGADAGTAGGATAGANAGAAPLGLAARDLPGVPDRRQGGAVAGGRRNPRRAAPDHPLQPPALPWPGGRHS